LPLTHACILLVGHFAVIYFLVMRDQGKRG
jgi:preprotein translocase subunit YajC